MVKRRLEDLFVRGDFVTFTDGKGEPITVWLQKLSPIEMSSAIRRANAARARVRALKNDRDSEEFLDLWAEVLEWERTEDLVDYLLAEPQVRIEERIEAELGAEGEWGEEGYLQGLRDAWADGGRDAYIVDPTSPEGVAAARTLAELERFAAEAAERCAPEIAQARAELEALPLTELQERALDRVIRYRASTEWIEEMHRAEIFYGTHEAVPDAKEPDKWVATHKRYFDKRDEISRLQGEVLRPLFEKYAELAVDVMEGKGSGETPTSSDSSEQLPEPAMGNSSGPVAVGP